MQFEFTREQIKAKATEMVPHLAPGLMRWVENGTPPGGFLTAVLTNDLLGAFTHGDDTSIAGLKYIFRFLYNHCPSQCWGSKEKVAAWRGLDAMEKGDAP